VLAAEMIILGPFILFPVFAVSFFFTVYFFNQNLRGALNESFFGLSIALCAFLFGLAMCFSGYEHIQAHLWRCVSVFGWVMFYTLLLQLAMNLSGIGQFFRKSMLHLLFFAPAIILIAVFCILDDPTGWAFFIRTYPGQNGPVWAVPWNIVFTAYYAVCSLVSLVIVYRWKRKSAAAAERRQAGLVFISVAVTFLLEIVSDVFMSISPAALIIMLAPVKFLLPFIVFLYLLRKNKLITPFEISRSQLIMSNRTSIMIYHSLGAFFYLFGIANIIVLMIKSAPVPRYDVVCSALLVLFGILLIMIQYLKYTPFRKTLNLYLSILSIPIFSIMYMGRFPGTYWVYPIIIIILSLIYNNRSMLVLVAIAAILTQTVIWIETPPDLPMFAGTEYILRIAFTLLRCLPAGLST
jgi:hypothetical protein